MSTLDHKVMRNLKGTGILDVYQFVLAIFLFASPWLFAFAHGALHVDTWLSAFCGALCQFRPDSALLDDHIDFTFEQTSNQCSRS